MCWLLCGSWPAVGIPLVRHEIDAQSILDAAERARTIFPSGKVVRDGQEWRLGTDAEVRWINDGTSGGTDITAAIPPIFAAYCTLLVPQNEDDKMGSPGIDVVMVRAGFEGLSRSFVA